MKCPFVIKVCSKCERILVANKINFLKEKKGKYGLMSICKECNKERNKKYKKENKEKIKEYNKKRRMEKGEELNKYNREYYEENKEKIKEQRKKYRKEYYKKNKEKITEQKKEYREKNKEKIAEYNRKYNEENPHMVLNRINKRRQLEENQGKGITKEQWLEMMNFFDWKCAYSGIQLNRENRSIDHIISLNQNGKHEIWNLVPMYMPYNSSKSDKDMLEWYIKQEYYSKERLNKIYDWIKYAKNKWYK